jgi:hypothetical protein
VSDTATRGLPTGLKAKLAPLLRLQASDNDGERANASAAIGRLLKNHGLDWHDLTEALLAEPKTAAREPQPSPGATTWKRSTGAVDLPRQQLLELLDLVEEHSPFLAVKSRGFVDSLRSRAWRPTVHLSEKQWNWLQDLLEQTGV